MRNKLEIDLVFKIGDLIQFYYPDDLGRENSPHGPYISRITEIDIIVYDCNKTPTIRYYVEADDYTEYENIVGLVNKVTLKKDIK